MNSLTAAMHQLEISLALLSASTHTEAIQDAQHLDQIDQALSSVETVAKTIRSLIVHVNHPPVQSP